MLTLIDFWPALISLLAVWLFSSKRYLAGGLVMAIGIGVKLYPILLVPPLLVLAWRQGKVKPLFTGLLLGLLPLGLLSFYLPWWRFAQFQADRGLQVESLYASMLWLGHLLGVADVHWIYTNKWYEVRGAAATAVLPWAHTCSHGAGTFGAQGCFHHADLSPCHAKAGNQLGKPNGPTLILPVAPGNALSISATHVLPGRKTESGDAEWLDAISGIIPLLTKLQQLRRSERPVT